MQLETLLNKIEEDAKKEISLLEENSNFEIEKIKKEGKEKIEKVKEEEEKRFAKERERVLSDYRKEKQFMLNMKTLEVKNNLLKEAKKEARKSIKELSFKEKKGIFKKILERESLALGEKTKVFVPKNKKKEMSALFEGVDGNSILEKDIDDGFVVDGEKFVLEVDLDLVVEEVVEKEITFFTSLLFKK